MRVRNISKIVLYYVIIHRKHIGKTIVVHNLKPVTHDATSWMRLIVYGVGSEKLVAILADTRHNSSSCALAHRRIHGPQTNVRRLWLIV